MLTILIPVILIAFVLSLATYVKLRKRHNLTSHIMLALSIILGLVLIYFGYLIIGIVNGDVQLFTF